MVIEERKKTGSGWRSFGPEILVLAGGAVFAILGRCRWADVLVDHGLCFSNIQGVLAGGRVFHEVRIQYGPVSVWLLSGLLSLFGVKVLTIVIVQFVIGLAAIIGLQFFARRFLSPVERWLCAALMTVVILWMSGPGNLLYPYRFAVSHALLAAVMSLELVARSLARGRVGITLAVGGAIAGAAFATKQEIGAAAFVGIVLMVLFADQFPARKRMWALTLAGLASGGAYAALVSIALHGRGFVEVARKNLLWPWAPIPEAWNQLYRRSQGLDHPLRLLTSVGDTLLTAAVFGGSIWLFIYGASISRRRINAVVIALLAGWSLWAWRWTEGSHFAPLTLCLPLLVASAILAAIRALRGDRPRPELGALFAIIAGALLLLSREGYRGELEGYYSGMGYVFVIPAAVPVLATAASGPSNVRRRRWIVVGISVYFLLGFGSGRLRELIFHWNSLVPFVTARGTVYSDRPATGFLEQEAALIESRTRRGDPVLMIPATGGLDFLLDRQNMSFFPNMVPGVIVGEDGERELIERWRTHPPRIVIESRRTLGVFRSGEFGEGWGRAAQRWIDENYSRSAPIDPAGRLLVLDLAPGKLR